MFLFFLLGTYKKIEQIRDFKHFEYNFVYKKNIRTINHVNNLYLKYKKIGPVKLLYDNTVWLQITNDEKFNYFSILNRGNYGFNGTNKMINKIKENGKCYYIIDYIEYYNSKNRIVFNSEISQYDYIIIDNSIEVESDLYFRVYLYEGE